MRGKFITFEGIDGSGKSTQLRMLASDLRVKGYNVLTTMEPGGTPLGRRLRESFLETEENVSPLAELLLFAADRAQHVELLIKPALEEGKIVISDRYADATFAYQGAGRGFPETLVNQVIKIATGGLKPDLTLVLRCRHRKSSDANAFARRERCKEKPDGFGNERILQPCPRCLFENRRERKKAF